MAELKRISFNIDVSRNHYGNRELDVQIVEQNGQVHYSRHDFPYNYIKSDLRRLMEMITRELEEHIIKHNEEELKEIEASEMGLRDIKQYLNEALIDKDRIKKEERNILKNIEELELLEKEDYISLDEIIKEQKEDQIETEIKNNKDLYGV